SSDAVLIVPAYRARVTTAHASGGLAFAGLEVPSETASCVGAWGRLRPSTELEPWTAAILDTASPATVQRFQREAPDLSRVRLHSPGTQSIARSVLNAPLNALTATAIQSAVVTPGAPGVFEMRGTPARFSYLLESPSYIRPSSAVAVVRGTLRAGR